MALYNPDNLNIGAGDFAANTARDYTTTVKRVAPRTPDIRQMAVPTPSATALAPLSETVTRPKPKPVVELDPAPAPVQQTPAPVPVVTPNPAPVVTQAPAPSPAPAQTAAPITDPNALDRFITPENTLRNQRIGFNVNPGNLRDSVLDMFRSQAALLDQEFADSVEQLAKQTAAMGRTGSGMYNKSFSRLSDRAQAARDALLGNLIFEATRRDLDKSMETDLARLAHLIGERGREDLLARQAMEDEANRLRFLSTAFGGAPATTDNSLAQVLLSGAGQYGANAGIINSQLGDAASSAVPAIAQLLRSIFGGGNNAGGTPIINDTVGVLV